MQQISFLLNGKAVTLEVSGSETLLSALRDKLAVKSVKEGCGIGECGTCTVLIDDEPHYACLTLGSKVQGRDVKTVEYLSENGLFHPLQEAFVHWGAVQCGYCTPGLLLSAYSLLLKNKRPSRQEIKEAISGNLCRCTGYVQVVEAIEDAARVMQKQEGGKPTPDNLVSSNQPRSIERATVISNKLRPQVLVPKTKAEALAFLSAHEDLTVIAGGTDLLIRLRKSEEKQSLLDIALLDELKRITPANGQIEIGPAVTHAQAHRDPDIKAKARSLSLACGWVGSPQIRNMGTIGGNLVNASPAADTIPPLLIHDTRLTLETGDRKRTCRLKDFITAPYRSRIDRHELVTAVELESLEGYREGYERVIKRAAWAISRISLAWAIQEEEGIYREVRLAVGSCTPIPFRAGKAEAFLKGKPKTREVIIEAAEMAVQEIREITGMRPSFAYKIPVARGMLEKVLRSQ